MRERRSEPRFLCADLVKIQIHASDQMQTETLANLEDISPSGACLQLEAAVGKGAGIEMIWSTCRLRGKVSYCRFVQTGYLVGVQFEKCNTWDSQTFRPKHLLDMPGLVQDGRRKHPHRLVQIVGEGAPGGPDDQ